MNFPKTEHKKLYQAAFYSFFYRITFIRFPGYHSLMINQIITFFYLFLYIKTFISLVLQVFLSVLVFECFNFINIGILNKKIPEHSPATKQHYLEIYTFPAAMVTFKKIMISTHILDNRGLVHCGG